MTARLSDALSTSSPVTVSLPVSSASRLRLTDLTIPTSVPKDLRGSFEAPHLIVPIDKAIPSKVVGNSYTVQLSPTMSTVLVYDVHPEYQGKLCNLVFFMPPAFSLPDLAPAKLRSPGGISVSRVNNDVATPDRSASSVDSSAPVGVVPMIQSDNQYAVASMPCEAGQRVAYQVDSVGGLDMDFFQMTSPPLGLFMIPS
jgi:glucan endo-1,3-beta-D-glucosidase